LEIFKFRINAEGSEENVVGKVKVQKYKGAERFKYEELHRYVRGEEGGRTSRRTV